MDKIDIKSLEFDEILKFVTDLGEKKFRATQIFSWLYKNVSSFDQMNNLSKELREKLDEKCYINKLEPIKKLCSKKDETVKYLFKLKDLNAIETVVMKYNHGYSICVSSQVGCAMGCRFCQSTKNGLVRNLTASEILDQILYAQNDLNIRISNIVMMGIGEPLHNFSNVIKFLKIVNDSRGLGIGYRHISLSTCGLVDKINELREIDLPIVLSISLHAPNDEIRKSIMPIATRYSIDELLACCKEYIKKTKRRISFEYSLIHGVNDSIQNADELAKRLKGMLCHVNLISVNKIENSKFIKPDINRIKAFQERLNSKNINATVRRTLGSDINASCGQLRHNVMEKGGK